MVSCSCNQPENWRYVLSNAHHWLGVCSRKREVERQRRDQRKREDMLRSEVDQSTRKLDSSLTSPTRTTASHDLPHQPQKEWRTCNTSPTQSYVVTNTGSNEHNDGSFSAEYTDESTSTRHDRPTDVLQLLRIKRPTASIATGLDARAEGEPICCSHPQVSASTAEAAATREVAAQEAPTHLDSGLSDLVRSVEASLARAAHARATAVAGLT